MYHGKCENGQFQDSHVSICIIAFYSLVLDAEVDGYVKSLPRDHRVARNGKCTLNCLMLPIS